MTENGDPKENGVAERFNGILKNEFIEHLEDFTLENAEKKTAKVIEIYNNSRPHLSLGMLTPNQAHTLSGQLNRLWRVRYSQNDTQNPENIRTFANADNKDDYRLDRSPNHFCRQQELGTIYPYSNININLFRVNFFQDDTPPPLLTERGNVDECFTIPVSEGGGSAACVNDTGRERPYDKNESNCPKEDNCVRTKERRLNLLANHSLEAVA